MRRLFFVVILFLSQPISVIAQESFPLQVQAVQLETGQKNEELLTIELSQPAVHRLLFLPNPPRLVIDLPPFQWRVPEDQLKSYRGTLVKNIRYARFDPQTSRIVLDLAVAADVIPLGTTAENNTPMQRLTYRLVATSAAAQPAQQGLQPRDMVQEMARREPLSHLPTNESTKGAYHRTKRGGHFTEQGEARSGGLGGVPPTRAAQGDYVSPPPQFLKLPAPEQKPKNPAAKMPLVVIDAGHGGQDPGTIGARRSQEKHITLSYAKALKEALERTGRFRAALTRADDRFILLRERFRIARRMNADVFISLHADSAPNIKAQGLSIYTLSEESSDAEAAALAAQENKVDVLAEMDLSQQDEDVAEILIDLAQRETKNKSIRLADTIVAKLNGQVPLLPNTHRYAGFAVLKAPDIPSALIEIGFLSHPQEETVIQTPQHRSKVVAGVVRGIEAYLGE